MAWLDTPCTAFEGERCIAAGTLRDVAPRAKAAADLAADSPAPPPLLVFADASSETIELDWRGPPEVFTARLERQAQALDALAPPEAPPAPDTDTPRGPGRPKLGVVAREVTLLPRHWEWLATQPGGASVALRKLVELAQRQSQAQDQVRRTTEVAYKFMSTMAGHLPGFEEASRALFAHDLAGFIARIAAWPVDVQAHLHKILAEAWQA
ncbi:DUF2239 family protein [Rhodoferax sp. WC2427]|uniref:DUF2239 family protein n=1 Tax=Rhodoferax sp. WC2427 TaxID=3234144 RepID=UPI0034673B43